MSDAFSPMLATLGKPADIGDEKDWAFELKWDGIRSVARVTGTTVSLTSRNGKDMTAGYPELAVLSSAVHADSATLDGEIVALDASGTPDFGLLQSRTNLANPAEINRLVEQIPVTYLIFDIIELDGKSLIDDDYDTRRGILERVVTSDPVGRIRVPEAFAGNLADAISTSKRLHLEGIVAKRRAGHYEIGKRSKAWTKIKNHRTQEVVIGGWRPGQGRRADSIGSLLLGIPDGDSIRYVGRVGTGFSDAMLEEIREDLSSDTRSKPTLTDVPRADATDAHWVAPVHVGEVEFAEWTSAQRLRQPTWRGWRTDKEPKDVRIE